MLKAIVIVALLFALQELPPAKLKEALKDPAPADWIYDDIDAGFAEAKKSGKPMLVTFRCPPCGPCTKIDGQVSKHEDEGLKKLLEKFVCVRIVQAYGMDLSLFQCDWNLSWSVYFLNADRTIYGRYGSRDASDDPSCQVKIEGFIKTAEGALELHAAYPGNKSMLAGKTGSPMAWKTPESIPTMKDSAKRANGTRGVCTHCHQVQDQSIWIRRSGKQEIPDSELWRYPMPEAIGVTLDPKERATIIDVARDSLFEKGDRIIFMEGQPIISIADVQWVLHHAVDHVSVGVERNGVKVSTMVQLAEGWRRKGSFAWRVFTWDIRHRLLGAIVEASPEGLKVTGHPPNWVHGRNAAGEALHKGDVIVEFDGKKDLLTESDLLAHLVRSVPSGKSIDIVVMRDGKRETVSVKIP